jgi:hypothetical protein
VDMDFAPRRCVADRVDYSFRYSRSRLV